MLFCYAGYTASKIVQARYEASKNIVGTHKLQYFKPRLYDVYVHVVDVKEYRPTTCKTKCDVTFDHNCTSNRERITST